VVAITLTPMETPVIQGSVLEWALEDAGVDRAQILGTLDSKEVLQGSLSGPIHISYEDLERIAKATHRSTYFFALPRPPKSEKESVGANFRAPASHRGKKRGLSSEERLAVRQAKRRQDIAAKLAMSLEQEPVRLMELLANESPQHAAMRAANWLGWDRRTHYTLLKSKTKVFVALREALESRGVLTNLVKVEGDSFRGFTLHHEYAPLIFVNAANKNPGSRSFTLLHELAHLLQGVDKACDKHDLQSRTSDESWCNRFAASFLIPGPDLARYMDKQLKADWVRAGDEYSLGRISKYFKASWYCVAIRLKEEGFADDTLVKSVSGDFQEQEVPGRAPGKTRPELRFAEFGQGFARLIDAGLSASRVSEIEARKLFRLNGSELRSLLSLGQGRD
jgi:Zn-dependent peptidase ImmA (M78 family)